MKFKFCKIWWGIFFLLLCWGKIECYGKEYTSNLNLFADSAVLLDGESGRILYEKNGNEFKANASTTKIMTCILALEMGKLEDCVSVSSYAASMPDVQMHIREGEKYRLEDLLYALMLESYNDVAVAIAEHIAGSQEKFSVLMNKKAKEIGCENTLFLTPNGLDATRKKTNQEVEEFHGTTAKDLALIMRYCINKSPKKEKFIQITSSSAHSLTDLSGMRSFQCQNHNSLFQLMEGVISGKTGFTGKAGYCYVGAVERDGRQYILALLACGWPSNRNYKWEDCKTLVTYGDKEYEKINLEQILKKHEGEFISLVKEGKRDDLQEEPCVGLVRKNLVSQTVLKKATEEIRVEIHKKELTAPVKKGEIAGEILYYIDNKVWAKEWLYSDGEIERIDFIWSLERTIEKIV